jgi:hypothetical protein
MPVDFCFHGNHVVVLTCEGEYGSSELREAWDRAEADPRWPSTPRICLDMRASASVAKRSTRDLRGTAERFIHRAERVGRCCALVARPGVQYGLMRMAGTWVGLKGVAVHVTTDLDDAIAWLEARLERERG